MQTNENFGLSSTKRKDLDEGFVLGLPDTLQAERLNICRTIISAYRRYQGISAKDMLERRLDSWEELIREGKSLDLIAQWYGVKSSSIRQMLWRERQFSFRQVKDELKEISKITQTRQFKKSTKRLFGI